MTDDPTCSRPRCDRSPKKRNKNGLCEQHYKQIQRRKYTPAQPIRDRIALLKQRGWGLLALAQETGISKETINLIAIGKPKQVQQRTADAIMSVPVPAVVTAGRGKVPITGTMRRIHALGALGWSQHEIAERAGLKYNTLRTMPYENVAASTAAAIADVFERLQLVTPPDSVVSRRVRTIAQREGWLPPLAWENIDDPFEEPTVRLLSTAEWHAELSGELTDAEIARELGIKPSSLQRALQRAS